MTHSADTQAQHVGMHAARALVRHHGGAAAVAHLMPRPDGTPKLATTVAHELACTGQYKLGLVDAMELSAGTGGMQILNAFAELMGCVVFRLPSADATDADVMQRVSLSAKEFAEFVAEVSADASDGDISLNDMTRIRKEGGELIQAVQNLMAHLQALHEAQHR